LVLAWLQEEPHVPAQLLTDTKIAGEIARAKEYGGNNLKGAARRTLLDSKVRGLTLRITRNGTATWSLQYRPRGSSALQRLTLGSYPDLGLGDARDLAEIKRGEIVRGIDPILVKQKQKAAQEAAEARPKFREAVEDYLLERIPKEKNRGKLRVMFKTELLPVLGDLALDDITRDHVLPICRRIQKRGSPHQARDVFSYARAVLNYSVEKGLIGASPLIGVKYGRPSKPRERYLTVEELREFWTRLDAAPMQHDFKDILRLQLLLGRRVGEVAGMERREIDMDAWLWTIPAERCKNSVELKVPLTKAARAIVAERIARNDGRNLLFPNTLGHPHDAKHIANSLRAAQDHFAFSTLMGQPNAFTTHDLRRSCGTYLRLLKIPDDVRAAVLGHRYKERVTDRHYNSADITLEVREALATWQAALQVILRGDDPFAHSAQEADDVEERAERRYMLSLTTMTS
jgi:integrase